MLLVVCATAVFALAGGSAAAPSPGVPDWHAWLCFPGSPTDWCNIVLKTTVVSPDGSLRRTTVPVAADPRIDCFYLYPTVSQQQRGNSTLSVGPAERSVAIVQAAEFSRVCRVFAPMYRQVTVYGHGNPYHGNNSYEYEDVLAAWRDYMARYNDGRGVVLIGHSEGAGLFTQLIEDRIERSPSERRLLVSAILLGGVSVKNGSSEGGSFSDVPACSSRTETGCVVAYSAWSRTPPSAAAEQSVGNSSEHVLCVNPADPGSTRSLPITPIFVGALPEGIVPLPSVYDHDLFVVFPDLYLARCVRQGTRAWLLVTRIHHAGDPRPTVQPILGPDWGLHAADVNIALANLVSLVASESHAWLGRHR